MINYTEQSSDQLHLYVINGEPNIEQFEVIEKQTITSEVGKIYFGILSESHFVTFKNEKLNLTEICACTTGSFAVQPIIDGELKQLEPILKHETDHWTYAFTQSKHVLSDEAVAINNFEHTLQHIFPAGDTPGPDPITIVGCTVNSLMLKIESIHSYPNENLFVRTQSQFTFKQI